jgi:GNAT superfamily N-acetyltransferase
MAATIRHALETDLPALRPLLEQLGYPLDADTLHDRFRAYADARGVTLLALDGERVVGLAFAIARHDLLTPPLAELQGLVVAAEVRSGGIGAKLLAAIEVWARDAGLAGITVGTRVERERAHKFYEANGYVLAKQWRVYRKHFGHTEAEA